jgi:hypothetical protein
MKNASVFLVVSVLTLSVLQNAYGFSGQGSGTEQDPYIITDVYQLQEMNNDLDAWYELGNDIDASDTINWNGGEGFVPIGTSSSSFTGTFDGQGYKITGLFINRPSVDYGGLFGYTGSDAIMKNVGVVDFNITGHSFLGGVVGQNYGNITNSYATGRVTGSYLVGGLIAYNEGGTITGSYWDTETSGQSTSDGGTGKTTAEMQTLSTFVSAGWDFGTPIWVYYTNGYPRLAWEPTLPIGDLNHDKVVNFLDFAILADHWLEGM